MINPDIIFRMLNICRLGIFFIFLTLPFASKAQLKLPRLISDGMVLQRDTDLTLWGWASRGEKVKLEFKGQIFEATTNEKGKWEIALPPQEKGGPYALEFSAGNEITIENVVFGDVWICSGQSNMELSMGRIKEKYLDIITNSQNPMIRQFLVPDKYDFKKEHDDMYGGEWALANPETVLEFSAVGYFFARELYDQYEVPIGLINAALGGSPVEAWMSEETLKLFPDAYNEMQRFKDDQLIHDIENADKLRFGAWYQKINELDQGLIADPQWSQKDVGDQDWKSIDIPGYWTEDASNGVYWFRKKFKIPEKHVGKPAKLRLGRIVDQDFAYINGQLVGTTGYKYPPRRYRVDTSILEKENTISVRVISQRGRGAFVPDKPYYIAVGGDTFALSGQWKYKLGATMKPLEEQTFVRWKPGGLYNRMIAPLINYTIKGVIWYQGESNADEPDGYKDAFSAMINNWRMAWSQEDDFPFLYVQLANFLEEADGPVESKWAELRQAQMEALSVPNTGMVVAIDLGEWNDVHPLNKEDVGYRLALLARKIAYNEKDLMASSPVPLDAEFSQNNVQITFSAGSGDLTTRDGKSPMYFALSNDDVNYYWAKAEILGNKVKISNDHVLNPTSVRYAWSNNPATANLVSEVGLPVSPFEMRKGLQD